MRIPLQANYFTIPEGPEPPRLIGSRCGACGEHYYPTRQVCAKAECLSRDLTEVLLGPYGTLYTHTFVHIPIFGSSRSDLKKYAVGQVDLDEGPRIQSVLMGEPGAFRIGQRMVLTLDVLRQDKDGNDMMIFRFMPSPEVN